MTFKAALNYLEPRRVGKIKWINYMYKLSNGSAEAHKDDYKVSLRQLVYIIGFASSLVALFFTILYSLSMTSKQTSEWIGKKWKIAILL